MNPATATVYALFPCIGTVINRAWIVQDVKLYDPKHATDGYLTVIYCTGFNLDQREWMTGIHDERNRQVLHGRVFADRDAALADFAARGIGGAA
jgi:hypothetical protein